MLENAHATEQAAANRYADVLPYLKDYTWALHGVGYIYTDQGRA